VLRELCGKPPGDALETFMTERPRRSWIRFRQNCLRPVILLAIVAAASACYAPPPGPSNSTPSLAGAISDDVTNRPIGGATISVGGQTTTSTVDGYYVTSTLERGSARIRVSHPNYVTTERQVDVNQYLRKADFRLQPK